MNTLIPWTARIEDYLRYRRRFGFALVNEESTLKNFAAFADHAELPDRLTAALAGQWARTSKRQSPITWARRIEVLRGFARYWVFLTKTPESQFSSELMRKATDQSPLPGASAWNASSVLTICIRSMTAPMSRKVYLP